MSVVEFKIPAKSKAYETALQKVSTHIDEVEGQFAISSDPVEKTKQLRIGTFIPMIVGIPRSLILCSPTRRLIRLVAVVLFLSAIGCTSPGLSYAGKLEQPMDRVEAAVRELSVTVEISNSPSLEYIHVYPDEVLECISRPPGSMRDFCPRSGGGCWPAPTQERCDKIVAEDKAQYLGKK